MNGVHENTEPRLGSTRWPAGLTLGFAPRFGRTALVRRQHHGPLRVQKPFYPEDGACHVYMLHPPGGMAGQDQLQIEVALSAQAHALVTTPASGKVYRSSGPQTEVSTCLRLARDASLDWLPQDTILFGGSRYHQTTRVELQSGSRFLGWDIISLGRPSSGDDYTEGDLVQSLRVEVDKHLILRERLVVGANDSLRDAPWGLQGHRAVGILLAYPACERVLATVRELILVRDWPGTGVTLLGDLLVVRALAPRAALVQARLTDIWCCLRPQINRRPALLPRVWAT